MSGISMTVVELPLFQRLALDVWDDAEREAFVNFIARNPEAGDVIPATGGVRKVRCDARAQGNAVAHGLSTSIRTCIRRFSCSWFMPRRNART